MARQWKHRSPRLRDAMASNPPALADATWGNGCERWGCRAESVSWRAVSPEDGHVREVCAEHAR